ncbi:[citrate (pro-3S)-lyase] ligase [Spiroplasma sp. ChiS]|uniref:GNAT family N-acetyltransferase n=1 Tax=Spiroplasma sp. ChiS TaxID=2099885 RepID=UPI000CF9F86A|nr:GNAT family N-acetyltransferase [Spiroplasma sp. ChiS]PQP78702.1 [citrate (pro-3S)-lyase] ligase [Spiroplasma sp. ChiS]
MDFAYSVKQVLPNEYNYINHINQFLESLDLRPDLVQEYGVIYNQKQIIGVIGRYLNNLKCLGVSPSYQGYNLANTLVTYMIEKIYQQGFNEVFVFTKPVYEELFQQLGFELIVKNEKALFLTNRYDYFQNYLQYLRSQKQPTELNGVIVLNANPFTKGHQYLIKKASEQMECVYLILVKEEASLFTYQQRLTMTKLGTKYLRNVVVLEGSYYLVSKNIFPSYFLPSVTEVIKTQTQLDTQIFLNYFVPLLRIKKRFVGEEPFSKTTNLYNETMRSMMRNNNFDLVKPCDLWCEIIILI